MCCAGSYCYMAPEMLSNQPYDLKSDVWSMGVILYELVTKQLPFSASLSIAMIDEVFCDFGPLPSLSLCEWQNGSDSLDWMAGSGLGTNWFGGPPSDSTTSTMEGGSVSIIIKKITFEYKSYNYLNVSLM